MTVGLWASSTVSLAQESLKSSSGHSVVSPPSINWGADHFDLCQRSNPFALSEEDLQVAIRRGAEYADLNPSPHSLATPVDLFAKIHAVTATDPASFFGRIAGLQRHPTEIGFIGGRSIMIPVGNRGETTRAFKISCYACHSNNLFGRQIVGATNKTLGVTSTLLATKKLLSSMDRKGAESLSEREQIVFAKYHSRVTELSMPPEIPVGFDTTVLNAFVANAKNRGAASSEVDQLSALVKPVPWWQSRFKSRWLVDGLFSNDTPVLLNFIGNEISFNSDLQATSDWLLENKDVLRALTTLVFNTEAPKYEDFLQFSVNELSAAHRGELLFEENCSSCHGHYPRKWQFEGDAIVGFERQSVDYPQPTVGCDVGTDRQRLLAAKVAEKYPPKDIPILDQSLSKIESIGEYIPPPLVGVWASWPYLHNGSVPTLRDLFEPSDKRPKQFYVGPSVSEKTDFDRNKNGFPVPPPRKWRSKSSLYDTSVRGQSNQGHDIGIFIDEATGQPKFTDKQKNDLLNYLKTL